MADKAKAQAPAEAADPDGIEIAMNDPEYEGEEGEESYEEEQEEDIEEARAVEEKPQSSNRARSILQNNKMAPSFKDKG